MSYLAMCTFDLKGADKQDYQKAYSELALIGLAGTLTSDGGRSVQLPTTMVAGKFDSPNVAQLRDYLTDKIKRAFTKHGLTSEILVLAGGDWGWGHGTT